MIKRFLYGVLCMAALAGAVATALPGVAGARGLQTALTNFGPFYGAQSASTFARTRETGASAFSISVSWADTAPRSRPASWDPANPNDPAYDWARPDSQVRGAVAAGLTPIVYVERAPSWAERSSGGPAGTNSPDPAELASFLGAAARRYNGATPGLPRVRYWQVWNEPNLSLFFNPQREGGKDVSPGLYRRMLNASAKAIHGVAASNRIVGGGTAPFAIDRTDFQAVGAYRFLEELLSKRADFDIWSTHPYTQGNAFHKAANPDSASLGDLPRIRKLLDRGFKRGRIGTSKKPAFWVTEFSWDSSPPDPKGVPVKLLRRWTAEALYQAWRSGVSLFTWFQLRDEPLSSLFQGGLYARCAGDDCFSPKPGLAAFRFPFVAYRRDSRVAVWGRTPLSTEGKVVVEQRVKGDWARLGTLRASRGGIFKGSLRPRGRGALRARRGDRASPSFSLKVPPDRSVSPFGS